MRLIVEIPVAGPEWRFVLLDDAQTAVRHGECTVDLLPQASDVVAVVPLAQCAWHAVQLPKGSDSRLLEVLQSQLEDHVLDDPSELHLALLNAADKSQSQGQRWVVVCNKAWLRAGLTALQRAQRAASSVTAFWLPAQNESEAQQWLCGNASAPMLAQRSALGVWALDAASAAFGQDAAANALSAEPHWAAWAEEKLQRPVAVSAWYDQLARCALPEHLGRGNLAQFDLSEFGNASFRHKLRQGLAALAFAPRWKAPRWGLLAFAVVNVVGINAYALRQQQQLANKRMAAQQLLTQTFAEVTVVVDAPAQMQKQISLLRQRNASLSADDFEAMLGVWAGSEAASKLPPQALVYRDKELRVRAAAPGANEQVVSALNQRLAGKSLRWYADGGELVLRAVQPTLGQAKP